MAESDEQAFMAAMREDGSMDRIMDWAGIEQPEAPETPEAPAPAPEAATTVEQPRDPETGQFVAEEPVAPAETAPEGESGEAPAEQPEATDEDGLYLDLTPEVESYLQKHDGDLSKALQAAAWEESVRGRQGNELGQLRQQLTEMQQQLQAQASRQPYPEFPDVEMDDPDEAARRLEQIAEAAFLNGDIDTFQRAYGSWEEVDPRGANAYRLLKQTEIRAAEIQASLEPRAPETDLEKGMQSLVEKYPRINEPEFQTELEAEVQKWPSLGAILRGETPGVTPAERLQAMEEIVQRVASRTTSEQAQQAVRRVAVRRSEEARAARQAAQVAGVGGASRPVGSEDVPDPLAEAFGEKSRGIPRDKWVGLDGRPVG